MRARFTHLTPVYRSQEIRHIETVCAAQTDPPHLMERAGLAAAELARDLAGSGKRVVVIAGPGNNGGDAFVLARHLKSWWFNVACFFAGDAQKLSADAAEALGALQQAGGSLLDTTPTASDCELIVDGLFGIGLQRELIGRYAELVSYINAARCPVLALDVPSGIESDTGRVLGCAVRASHTITFIGLKPGLLTLDGPEHCGEIHVATLGVVASSLATRNGHVIGPEVLRTACPSRKLNTHKGDFGSVGIVGGASGMVGAALLAGRAAIKVGAGRVYVGLTASNAPMVDTAQPELMLRGAEEVLALEHLTALAVGPGLGISPESQRLLGIALASSLPLVLDADALNLIATATELRAKVMERSATTLLTPHPAEAARLLGVTTAKVQEDRVAAALKLAGTYRCGIVLKGAGSICAWPDGTWAINTGGNPGMASAGMGDVLTGIIAALLAQHASADIALRAGVYLHSAAADAAVQAGIGPVGLTASDVIDAARVLINKDARERLA
jgi:ADP-dependent NAD(P)H-hydrate dehydratase / NAD(P)H-hydrate epimerase